MKTITLTLRTDTPLDWLFTCLFAAVAALAMWLLTVAVFI